MFSRPSPRPSSFLTLYSVQQIGFLHLLVCFYSKCLHPAHWNHFRVFENISVPGTRRQKFRFNWSGMALRPQEIFLKVPRLIVMSRIGLGITDLRNPIHAHHFNYHDSPITSKCMPSTQILEFQPICLSAWLIRTLGWPEITANSNAHNGKLKPYSCLFHHRLENWPSLPMSLISVNDATINPAMKARNPHIMS